MVSSLDWKIGSHRVVHLSSPVSTRKKNILNLCLILNCSL
ncbi:Pentatricopeptide repeat-containing protein [Zea mays]|nr:Pentatricopeptide repeat-containing protein [Zea mays]